MRFVAILGFVISLTSCVNQGTETTSFSKDSILVDSTEMEHRDSTSDHVSIDKEINKSFQLIQSQKFKFEDKDIVLNHYLDSINGTNLNTYTITTLSGMDTIDDKIYKRIEAQGGLAAVLVPIQQPSKDYFVLVKFGDYDGNILLVDHVGMIRTIRGGNFFITDDQRYLVSPYDSDCAGLTVFDLKEDSLIYDKTCENDAAFNENSFYGHWYKGPNHNYYWLGNYGDTDTEGFYWVYQFSFEDKKLRLEKVRKEFIDKLEDVHWVELMKK